MNSVIDTLALRRFLRHAAGAGIFAFGSFLFMTSTDPQGAVHGCLATDLKEAVWWQSCTLDLALYFLAPFCVGLVVVCSAHARGIARFVLAVFSVVALLVAIGFLSMTMEHNPQGVFCDYVVNDSGDWVPWAFGPDSCAIQWHTWLPYGLLVLSLTLPPILLMHGLIVLATRLWPRQLQRWRRDDFCFP